MRNHEAIKLLHTKRSVDTMVNLLHAKIITVLNGIVYRGNTNRKENPTLPVSESFGKVETMAVYCKHEGGVATAIDLLLISIDGKTTHITLKSVYLNTEMDVIDTSQHNIFRLEFTHTDLYVSLVIEMVNSDVSTLDSIICEL